MKRELAEERSPLDACLESVLPGVHQWHHANHAAVSSLRDDTKIIHNDMNLGFKHVIAELQETRRQRVQQQKEFANLLEMGRRVLLTGTTIETTTFEPDNESIMDSPPPLTNDAVAVTAGSLDNDAELELHKTYTMRPKHKLLTELMSEWIGVGDFNDPFGGIEGRNKKFGAKWRKHLPKYTYSRTERTIKGIRAFAKDKQINEMDACRQLQEVYEQQKMSVKNMVDYFTKTNLVSKRKARGKAMKKRSDEPSTPTDQQPPRVL
jgi:Transcriptional activator of glycolytic enzymes